MLVWRERSEGEEQSNSKLVTNNAGLAETRAELQ